MNASAVSFTVPAASSGNTVFPLDRHTHNFVVIIGDV
jgi:hypothetical protein